MKKLILAIVATAAFSGSALAADLAARPYAKAPPMMAVAPSWTGCYVGAGWGYGMSDDERSTSFLGVPDMPTTTSAGKGWLGSVGGGCDYQLGTTTPFGPVVVGLLGDYSFSNIKGSFEDPLNSDLHGTQKISDAWYVGARVGLLVNPDLLTYVSGGWTGAHINAINFVFPDGTPRGLSLPSQNANGWFLGSGVEYKFNFLPINGLFWKNEYRYSTYDNYDQNYVHTTFIGTNNVVHNRLDVQTFTTSLVYRFNWAGPAVAKY